MRLKITLIFVFSSIANLIYAQTNFERGMEYYQKRANGASEKIAPKQNIDLALSYFEKAFATSDAVKAGEYFMKSCYFKSTYCYPEGSKERKAILINGKEKGKDLLIKYPESAPLHYWYAVMLGSWAKESGVIAAAKEGIIDKLKTECELVINLKPNYDYGAGYRFLGILHLDAPYIPIFLNWPNDDTAVELLRKSLKFNPNHISGQYHYAKALNQTGNKERAIEVLKKVTLQEPNTDQIMEEESELDLCKKLLLEITK